MDNIYSVKGADAKIECTSEGLVYKVRLDVNPAIPKTDPEVIVKKFSERGRIPQDYVLVKKGKLSEDSFQYYFVKDMGDCLDYTRTIKLIIDEGQLVYYCNSALENEKMGVMNAQRSDSTFITKERAIEMAKEYLLNKGDKREYQAIDCVLEYRPIRQILEKRLASDEVYSTYVYRIQLDNGVEKLIVTVEAKNGALIDVDMECKAKNKTFYVKDSFDWWNIYRRFRHKANCLSEASENLGFENIPKERVDYDANKKMKAYLARTDAYASTFAGHGNYNVIGTSQANSKPEEGLRASEVPPGVYNFVFLSGCSTNADNSEFRSAFSIYPGTSGRALIGYYEGVETEVSDSLAEEFLWQTQKGANKSIYSCLLDAIASGPADMYYPVRFTGDKSYKGNR